MPFSSIVTGVPSTDAPETVVPPVSLVAVPSDVAVRSVTTESMTRIPRRLKSLIVVFTCTVTVEPSVVVVDARSSSRRWRRREPSARGMVARAAEPFSPASTAARSPGAGSDSAVGAPKPEVALTRYG